jgi:DNA modification methylase
MTIEYKPLKDIKPYVNNAKLHPKEQVEQIKRSIQEFGFNDPIAIDEHNVIIEGHGRFIAVKELGYTEVPVIQLSHLTEAQKRAYIIAHNKLTLNSGFDIDILKKELKEIQNTLDVTFTGFDIDTLSSLLEQEKVIIEDDFDVTPPEEAKSKLGDLWLLDDHRLLCGDSTEKNYVIKLVNNNSIDFVFTDPPWNVNYGAIKDDNQQGYKPRTIMNDSMSTEAFKDFMLASFENMSEVVKHGAMVYVVMSAQEWANVMLALNETDFHWSSTIIWNKDHLVLSRKDYHTKYEPIWYGWRNGEARLNPLLDRKQSDVWDIDRPIRSDLHPTMKPLKLIGKAMENSSKINDNVLDLFGGSGSTLITAEQLNRQCYMMELDPKYIDVIVHRYKAFKDNADIKLIRDGNTYTYDEIFGGDV